MKHYPQKVDLFKLFGPPLTSRPEFWTDPKYAEHRRNWRQASQALQSWLSKRLDELALQRIREGLPGPSSDA